jgi:hypothetical protein
MVGTALTGYGWQSYYVTGNGDLLVHVGDTATAHDGPPQLLGHYESADVARAVAHQRLRRDVRMATEDMRVAFADIAALIESGCDTAEWAYGPVAEAPVGEITARRCMPGLIRA